MGEEGNWSGWPLSWTPWMEVAASAGLGLVLGVLVNLEASSVLTTIVGTVVAIVAGFVGAESTRTGRKLFRMQIEDADLPPARLMAALRILAFCLALAGTAALWSCG